MKLTSVNCGLPREVARHGRSVTTSVYKEPVGGHVALRRLNLDGDRQADMTVHGGKDKAVYCHRIEHYEYWRRNCQGDLICLWAFSGRTSRLRVLRRAPYW